jgi:hypothetical protein
MTRTAQKNEKIKGDTDTYIRRQQVDLIRKMDTTDTQTAR